MKSDSIKKGAERAPHRALLRSLGVSPNDFGKPFIGVVNSFTDVVPGHQHLREIAEAVKSGVRQAGGVPFEFNTIAVCDGLAMNHTGMKYSLASRELIADTVEIMAQAHAFDGLVFIPNCDKVIPGMLMAAVRLNIPAVFVSGGPMLAGHLMVDGKVKKVDLSHVFEAVGQFVKGDLSAEKLEEIEGAACPGCGSCSCRRGQARCEAQAGPQGGGRARGRTRGSVRPGRRGGPRRRPRSGQAEDPAQGPGGCFSRARLHGRRRARGEACPC